MAIFSFTISDAWDATFTLFLLFFTFVTASTFSILSSDSFALIFLVLFLQLRGFGAFGFLCLFWTGFISRSSARIFLRTFCSLVVKSVVWAALILACSVVTSDGLSRTIVFETIYTRGTSGLDFAYVET